MGRRASRRTLAPLVALAVAAVVGGALVRLAGASDAEATSAVEGFELTCPPSVVEGGTLLCELENVGDDVLDWPGVALSHRSDDSDRALVAGRPIDVEFVGLASGVEPESGVWWVGDVLVAYSRIDLPRLDADDVVVESLDSSTSSPHVGGGVQGRSVGVRLRRGDCGGDQC